ncbi:hypothetical protein TFLX_04190 [Thermoflexales bacterium]|nr:hypothetical protein TFLX_04190 [Thermoflexales bacterium]
MELIFIVGIIIAIIGGLTIAAVIWQSDTRSAVAGPDNVTAPPPPIEAVPVPPLPDDFLAPPVAPPSKEPEDEASLTIEAITAIYAHANDEVAVADNALQLNVANVLATQIERLYEEYVQLGEERSKLAETLLTHMLFEKIERSAGRLEIATERETLDLRERFSQVSANYDRVQFRLGSLQHLNTRLDDPRVAEQLDDLVMEIRRLANKTHSLS